MLRVLLTTLALSIAVPAVTVDLSGTWQVVIPAGSQKRADGSNASWKEMRGSLTVTQTNDELRATWRSIDDWAMTGRVDAEGRFVLESGERQVPGPGGSVAGRWTMRGALKDGQLAGTAAFILGDREPIMHKWTASRKSSS
jgi:hypothetical protein